MIERIERELAGITDIIPTPREAVAYAITQFIAFLRETKTFDIPVDTTMEIVKTIKNVAEDPEMHVKLLNEKWFKNLIKSFIAKDPDQDAIFDVFFTQALEMGAGDIEQIKERQKHNIAMKFFGDEIRKIRGQGNFSHDYTAKIPSNIPFSISNVIDDLYQHTKQKGYDPAKINDIDRKIPNSKKNRPIQANLLDILKEEMESGISMFKEGIQLFSYDTPEQRKAKDRIQFDGSAFTENWMRGVIRKAYGLEQSPVFDAVIDDWLMKQRQKTIESDLSVEDREEATLTPNVLLGAVNDFLKQLHGDEVPRVYDFPFKRNEITESIEQNAAADALALVNRALTFKDIRQKKIPNQYTNLIERTLYLRALKKHARNFLSGIVTITPDMDEYEIDRIIDAHEEWKRRIAESYEQKEDDEYESTGSSQLYNLLGADRGTTVTTVYEAKTDEQKVITATAAFIETVVKNKEITWTFKSGPNAGKTVKIDNISDYKLYRKEQSENIENAGKVLDKSVRKAMNDLVDPKDPFFSRKNMRDLKDLIDSIPDKKKRDELLGLLGDDTDKYDTGIIDKINDLVDKITDDKIKEKIDSAFNDVSIPRKDAKKLQDALSKSGDKGLVKDFKKTVDKSADFNRDEMERFSDLIDQFKDASERENAIDNFNDARVSRKEADDLIEKAGKIGKKKLEDSIKDLFDTNRLKGKDIAGMDDLLANENPNVRDSVEKAMDEMQADKHSIDKLKEAAKDAGNDIEKKLDDIIGSKKSLSFKDAKDMRDAIRSVTDEKARKNLERAFDQMDFTASGMNDASQAIDGVEDQKTKNAMKRLLDKKVSPNEAKKINDIMQKVKAIADDDVEKTFDDVMDKLSFKAKGFDEIEKSVEDADDKYDTKKAINDLLDGKPVTIPGKNVKDLKDKLENIAKGKGKDIDDLIDGSRFASDPVGKASDLLDDLPNDDGVKSKLKDLMDTITGRKIDKKNVEKMKDIVKDVDPKASSALEDIIDDAMQNGKKRNQESFADMIKDMIDDLEDADAKHGEQLKKNDKGAWEASKDTIEFLKRIEKAARDGEDPSKLFDNINARENLNTVVKRLAQTPKAEDLAVKWLESFHKMFNKFSDQASDEENKAMFDYMSKKMQSAENKVKKKIERLEISKELRKRYDEANKRNKELKEKFNEELAGVMKSLEGQGIDPVELMKELFTEEVRSAREGGGIVPQPRTKPLIFARNDDRCFIGDSMFVSSPTFGSKSERTFLTPKIDDVNILQDTGGEQSPWTFVKYWMKESADEFIGKAGEFGNMTKEQAVKKLTGETKAGPDPGDFITGGDGDPLGGKNPFIDLIDQLEGVKAEDVKRDFFRKLGGELFNELNPERMGNLLGDQPIPDPTEELDIEGDIDIPHLRNPMDDSDSPQMTIESKDPMYQKSKQKKQKGAGGAGGEMGGESGGEMGGEGEAAGEGQGGKPGQGGKAGRGMAGTKVIRRGGGGTGVEIPGVKPGTGQRREEPELKIEGIQDFVSTDPLDNIEKETNETIDKFLNDQKDIEGARFDGIAMDPVEIFDDDAIWDNKSIAEKLKQMVDKPSNAAAMKKLFRNKFRNEVSQATEQKRGRRKVDTIDRHRVFRENFRNGYNPKTGRPIVTKLPKNTVKPIKRDIFVVDVSGSMYSFLGPVSQLIASLTEPTQLKVVLFDDDAVTIDSTLFSKNPAAIFFAPTEFAKAAALKQQSIGKRKRGWQGNGVTSYDSANMEVELNKLTKGDRVILIGDMEHNTFIDENKKLLDEMVKKNLCDDPKDCIAKWFSNICKKVDSCLAINPKIRQDPADITCNLIKYNVPVCFSGASEGTDTANTVTGKGLQRTVKCLVQGLTGQSPKIDKSVLDACKENKQIPLKFT